MDDERRDRHAGDELGSGPPELGIGLDRESTAGTGDDDAGTGLDYDFEERRVTEGEQGDAADRVERERRESGI